MPVELVPSRSGHLGYIASNMRAIDQRECHALGHAPKAALRLSRRRAVWSLTAMVDGRPAALMGLTVLNMVEGWGSPFLLGTNEIYKHGRTLLARGPAVIALMRQTTPTLLNMVSADNIQAIRLLRHLGFMVGEAHETHGGVDFVQFSIGAVADV